MPRKKLPSSQKNSIARAMDNNPAIHSAQYDVDAAMQAKRNAKSAMYPRLDMELSASRNQNLDGLKGANNDALAMVRMSYNLYRGGADLARKRERASRVEEARQRLEQDRRIVRENVQKAWNSYETTSRRMKPLKSHVAASDKTRIAYKSQFGIGQRSLLDLLDSEVELFNARSAYIDAKYAESFAIYEVLMNTGDVVEHLGLSDEEVMQIKGGYVKPAVKAEEAKVVKPAAKTMKTKSSGINFTGMDNWGTDMKAPVLKLKSKPAVKAAPKKAVKKVKVDPKKVSKPVSTKSNLKFTGMDNWGAE